MAEPSDVASVGVGVLWCWYTDVKVRCQRERETPEAAESTCAISVTSNTETCYYSYLAERAKQVILEFKSLPVMWKGQGYRSCPIWIPSTEVSLCISKVHQSSCPCSSKSYAYIRFLRTWKHGAIVRSARTNEGIQLIIAYCFPFRIMILQHYVNHFVLKCWNEVNA
jgi:hypothetical protein